MEFAIYRWEGIGRIHSGQQRSVAMAKITGILCQIITGNRSGAGTDGSVYLGFGGREFRLDSKADDYESGSWREYVLGEGPLAPSLPAPQILVENKEENDPRTRYPLDTAILGRAPVYIRFEPEGGDDRWNLEFAAVLVYVEKVFVAGYTPRPEFDHLWMSNRTGKILYLTEEWRRGTQALLDLIRERAARAR
jgi:hypothetical protein